MFGRDSSDLNPWIVQSGLRIKSHIVWWKSTKAMNVRAVERQKIETYLLRAIMRQEFVLHYQSKIALDTGAITGSEALLRWNHPNSGEMRG